jgi:hypothetical protein
MVQFLRKVAWNEMDRIPPGQLPAWSDHYWVALLPGRLDGRPRKTVHPLWDAYEKAKAENPRLSRAGFVVRHCKLKRSDDAAIRKWKAQLKREEKVAERKLYELPVPEF